MDVETFIREGRQEDGRVRGQNRGQRTGREDKRTGGQSLSDGHQESRAKDANSLVAGLPERDRQVDRETETETGDGQRDKERKTDAEKGHRQTEKPVCLPVCLHSPARLCVATSSCVLILMDFGDKCGRMDEASLRGAAAGRGGAVGVEGHHHTTALIPGHLSDPQVLSSKSTSTNWGWLRDR